MDPALMERILMAELTLLNPAVRTDPNALEFLLAPEFTEIGQSGTFWTRDAVISDLLGNDQTDYGEAEAADFRFTELAAGCYLFTYLIQIGERRSRRSSIWREVEGELVMVFHQGTASTDPL